MHVTASTTPTVAPAPTASPAISAAAAAAAKAPDGDYKTKGAGHEVKDSDGDYKPQNKASLSAAANSSSPVLNALLNLKKGG